MWINFRLNTQDLSLDINANLRTNILFSEDFSLTGMRGRYEKDHGLFLLNGSLANAAKLAVFNLQKKTAITFEGLEKNSQFSRVQQALNEENLFFCPTCYSSQTILLFYLLRHTRQFSRSLEEIYDENIECSCFSYAKIFSFLRRYSKEGREEVFS